MKQNDTILKHMRERGSITTMIAFKRYGITRLSARILELSRSHLINGVAVHRKGKRYKAYSLVEA